MYQLLQLSDNKTFNVLSSSANIDDCFNKEANRFASDETLVVLYDFSDPNLSSEESDRIMFELLERNDGRITRFTKGIDISKREDSVCCGAGSRCFCVTTPGSRRCETYYCSASGVCAWVPCPIPCGC